MNNESKNINANISAFSTTIKWIVQLVIITLLVLISILFVCCFVWFYYADSMRMYRSKVNLDNTDFESGMSFWNSMKLLNNLRSSLNVKLF